MSLNLKSASNVEAVVRTGFVYLRPHHVAMVQARGPYAVSAAEAWDKMFDWMRKAGILKDVGTGYGLLFDDPRETPPERCRYGACIGIDHEWLKLVPEAMSLRRLPGGAYARSRHVGGPHGLGIAISKVRNEGLAQEGLMVDRTRPLIEIYLDNPFTVPVEKQRVDVCIPVAVTDVFGRAA
jgi:AraC family transcriptional regulator